MLLCPFNVNVALPTSLLLFVCGRFRCSWFPVWASARPEARYWFRPGQKERQTARSHCFCLLWFGVWQGKEHKDTLWKDCLFVCLEGGQDKTVRDEVLRTILIKVEEICIFGHFRARLFHPHSSHGAVEHTPSTSRIQRHLWKCRHYDPILQTRHKYLRHTFSLTGLL